MQMTYYQKKWFKKTIHKWLVIRFNTLNKTPLNYGCWFVVVVLKIN